MSIFVYIIVHIIFPLGLLVSIGFVAQKKLKMDSRTFSRINVYVLIPIVLFIKVYYTNITLNFFAIIFVYIISIQLSMLIIGELVSRFLKHSRSTKKAFCNSLLFFNSGNYGLPLAELAFKGNPIAVTSQIFIMIIQNITTNTVGVFQASSARTTYKKALHNVLMMPTIYVLIIILSVKLLKLTLPEPILVPLKYISDGFVGFALLTLGVQLAEIKMKFKVNLVLLASFIRLIISPIIGLTLVLLLGIKGVFAQALIIGASTPSAVNTVIIAKEYDNEPEYASQVVFVSTILSSLTISSVIYLVTRFL